MPQKPQIISYDDFPELDFNPTTHNDYTTKQDQKAIDEYMKYAKSNYSFNNYDINKKKDDEDDEDDEWDNWKKASNLMLKKNEKEKNSYELTQHKPHSSRKRQNKIVEEEEEVMPSVISNTKKSKWKFNLFGKKQQEPNKKKTYWSLFKRGGKSTRRKSTKRKSKKRNTY
jgi:hypothetical protein